MKRTKIKLAITLLGLLGGLYFYSLRSEDTEMNHTILANIEALAQSEENPKEDYACFGLGDIECHGDKVEFKISGFRLKQAK